MGQNSDIYYSKDYYSSNAISVAKMQIQKTIVKESRPKEIKLADGKSSALSCFDKTVKPNYQEKKKKY